MGDVPKPPVPDIVIEILGGEWPEGSETAMYALADVWDAAAENITEIVGDSNTALDDLISHIEGESKESMRTSMAELIDGETGLSVLADDYTSLAELCRGFGGDLEKTKWIINVAMVEAVASLGFMFLGPLGIGAAAAKLAAKKLAIRAAIKGVIKKVASEGATTSLKAAAKKAPTVMAKEISHQAVTEAAVDQAGRRIAAADGSTSTSFSESGGALRDGAVYGAGSSLARRGMGRGSTRAGQVTRNAAEGVAGTTAVSLSHNEIPDAKDLTIGAAEGMMGGNHHGSGTPGSDASESANPGPGPNVDAGSPTTVGSPADTGATSTTPNNGDPGGPGPGQSVTPGDPGGSPPGPVAGESVSPVGADGAATGDAGAGGHGDGPTHADTGTHSDTGAHTDGGAQADGGTHSDSGAQSDGAGQTPSESAAGGGDNAAQSGSGAQADGAGQTSSESATSGGEGAGEGDSASPGSDTSTGDGNTASAPGSDASSNQSSDTLPNGDNLSGLDLGGTGGDSATSSNLTDAAGFTGDPGSSTGAGTGDTSSSPAGGDSSGAFASSDSSSTSDNRAATGGEHTGQEHSGEAAAPPVSAMSAASAGAGGTAGGSSSSSAAAKGPAPTGDQGTPGDTGSGEGGSDDAADPAPGGESVTPDSGETTGEATNTDETTPGEAASDPDIVAADADSGTDAAQAPEGLPTVEQHSDTAAPAEQTGDAGESRATDAAGFPDSDHLSGLDLVGGHGTVTPTSAEDSTPSIDSTPTDTSGSDSEPGPSSASDRPTTPTKPDDVDTTDCAHNALDALAERHPDLPSDRSGVGDRGDGPVPAGALYEATGITPDLHPHQGTDQAGHPDDGATDAYDAISDRLTELGDGSTALVTSNWTSGTHTGGHTYLAHNDGGDITFTDPTSGETHPWPPTYSDVGDVAAGYVNPDGTPAHGNSTSENVSSTIGDVDANKEPATYTDWESADRSDLHPDFDSPTHSHPDGAISEQEVRTRTATLPNGETVTIEERRTVYEPGHPPGQDPPPRDGERVTVTTTSVSAGDNPDVRNTVTWTEHGTRTVEAEFNLRHSFEGMGRTSEEMSHQRDVSGGVAEGTNQYGAIKGDHAGHVVAHRFLLDQGLHNLFPQNGNFNTSAYKKMENELAALVNDGLIAEGRIEFDFDNATNRPGEVAIEFRGIDSDGNVKFKPDLGLNFDNSYGQDYARTYGRG